LFQLRLHFVLKERIGIEEIGAEQLLTSGVDIPVMSPCVPVRPEHCCDPGAPPDQPARIHVALPSRMSCAGDESGTVRHLTLSRSDTRVRVDVEERNLFCIRLHFVLEERIGVEKISAERFLTIDEAACRHVFAGRNHRWQKSWVAKFLDHRKRGDDLVLHRG